MMSKDPMAPANQTVSENRGQRDLARAYSADFGDDTQSRDSNTAMVPQLYLGVINQIERLHRQFLEVIKNEIEHSGVQDINNIQTIILYNIGDEEVTVGELTNRGYYLGSNVFL